jgi:hypothetical protein
MTVTWSWPLHLPTVHSQRSAEETERKFYHNLAFESFIESWYSVATFYKKYWFIRDVLKLLTNLWDEYEWKDKYSIIFPWNSCQIIQVICLYFKTSAWRSSWTGTVIRSKRPGKILETGTLEDETTMSSPDIGNQLHSDAVSHPRRTENSNTALSKPKISLHIIHLIIIITIFLHGLGRLTCSVIDPLPSFPGSFTISSSSRFVV